MPISVGYYGIHNQALHASPVVADRVARLLTDPRWPWQPALVRPMQFPGRPVYPWPAGKVPAARLLATLTDIIRSDDTSGVHLVTSRQDAGNHAWVNLQTGQGDDNARPDAAYPFDCLALCRASGTPPNKRIEDWIELMHDLTTALASPHAVIWANSNERPIVALQFGIGTAAPDTPVDSPQYEVTRVARSRNMLGERFIRPPAWGTYLKPEHVDAVGGRERLAEVVRPPVMRDVGNLLYVQLSSRIDDAIAPETEARRRAFAELLDPITVPRPMLA